MDDNWLNPLNKMRWQEALKAKQTTITLIDGRRFNIFYRADGDTIFIEPINTSKSKSLVPRGTMSITRILEEGWLEIVGY